MLGMHEGNIPAHMSAPKVVVFNISFLSERSVSAAGINEGGHYFRYFSTSVDGGMSRGFSVCRPGS
jgi:hypothetical protein